MGAVYRKAKRDANEERLVEYLRKIGASVAFIDESGQPDLWVGYCGLNLHIEVKNGKGKLTPTQKDFIQSWKGIVYIARTYSDCKRAIRSEVLRSRGHIHLETVS